MTTASTPETTITTRWCVRADMPDVVRIDTQSFLETWSESPITGKLKDRSVVSMVADQGTAMVGYFVAGYIMFECVGQSYEILRLAVDPNSRRLGAGSKLVEHLKNRLSTKSENPTRGRRLYVHVPEDNLSAQLFFSALGFVAVARPQFTKPVPDHYCMVYTQSKVNTKAKV